jgi:nicotinamidase-related amidase
VSKQALIVVDMQRGLSATPRHDAAGLVERINKLAERLRVKRSPVSFIEHCGTGAINCDRRRFGRRRVQPVRDISPANQGRGGAADVDMSMTFFQDPSDCFFQIVRACICCVEGVPCGPFMVTLVLSSR